MISLQEKDTVLAGPFYFSTPIFPAKSSARVGIQFWNFISKTCEEFSILPPVLSHSEKSSIVFASRLRCTLPSISEQIFVRHLLLYFTNLCYFLEGRESHCSHSQVITLVPDNIFPNQQEALSQKLVQYVTIM